MFTIYPVLAGAIPDSLFYVRSAVTYRSDRLITDIPYQPRRSAFIYTHPQGRLFLSELD